MLTDFQLALDTVSALLMRLAVTMYALAAVVGLLAMPIIGIRSVLLTLKKEAAMGEDSVQLVGGPKDGTWERVNGIERLWFPARTKQGNAFHTYVLARKLKNSGPLQWRYYGIVQNESSNDEPS